MTRAQPSHTNLPKVLYACTSSLSTTDTREIMQRVRETQTNQQSWAAISDTDKRKIFKDVCLSVATLISAMELQMWMPRRQNVDGVMLYAPFMGR